MHVFQGEVEENRIRSKHIASIIQDMKVKHDDQLQQLQEQHIEQLQQIRKHLLEKQSNGVRDTNNTLSGIIATDAATHEQLSQTIKELSWKLQVEHDGNVQASSHLALVESRLHFFESECTRLQNKGISGTSQAGSETVKSNASFASWELQQRKDLHLQQLEK